MTFEQLQDIRDQKKLIGDTGEDFALRYELQRLRAHPLKHLIRLAGRKDIGLGYDLLSLESEHSTSNDRYIEVKTYSGHPHFFLSQSEYTAAVKHGNHYYIYLIDRSRIDDPHYEPTVIRDPANTITDTTQWSEKIQNREYTLLDSPSTTDDTNITDSDIILVGCFNNNDHLNWIQHYRCYNVRYRGNGYCINGSIRNDDVSRSVTKLLLYNVREPRTYYLYAIDNSMIVNRARMLSLRYPNPHSQEYILYHLTEKLPTPPLDIMSILRTNNDKLQRTSGTPIYMSGTDIMKYRLTSSLHATLSPKRVYTNTGKPWTEVQTQQLKTLFLMGTSIALISKRLYRDVDEIHAKLQSLGLE